MKTIGQKFLIMLAELIIEMDSWNDFWWNKNEEITVKYFAEKTKHLELFKDYILISSELKEKVFEECFKKLVEMNILKSITDIKFDMYGNKEYGIFYHRLPITEDIKKEIFLLKLQ